MEAPDEVHQHLVAEKFLVPQGGDKVYKDECVYSFDTPKSEGGIYVCLSTLLAVSPTYIPLHVKRTGRTVFLHLKKVVKPAIEDKDDAPPEKKPTKLAIGVEGGFDVSQDKVEYEDINSLMVTNKLGTEIYGTPLPNPRLPLNVQLSIAAILAHQGATLQEDIQAWEDKRLVSKYALNLKQLDNGVKIPPRGWKCSMCDLTQNLWLNLTDGTILCGRKYYDGTGGNNHAIEYYEQTRYPLAVKLGTITSEGGDVFSYDEDDMFEDPKLAEHLNHFGINIALLEKTDKTMTELEIEANLSLKAEWDAIQESGKKLQPLFGAGYTGMINLGNSCYMNSVMQVLFSMNEFTKQYGENTQAIYESSTKSPPTDFNVQMAKLCSGLLSGVYSKKPESDDLEALGVRPQMFKSLVGRGHPEFSTNHQQDAQEFFLHMMDVLEKNEVNPNNKLQDNFTFQLEDRIQCTASNKVQYKQREDMMLGLLIAPDDATNKGEYDQFLKLREEAEKSKQRIDPSTVVRLNIPFDACIKSFFDNETVTDYYSTAIKGKTTALKQTRFSSFPEYLVVQLRKFTIDEDWRPSKLDVSVEVPDEIDFSSFRSTGPQSGEEMLPDDDAQQESNTPQINVEFVGQLMEMGFPLEACQRAVHFTNNQGVEAAMNWVFEHSQDADFATPLQLSGKKDKNEPSLDSITMIVSMGFTEHQARLALKKTNNNVEAAGEWILMNLDNLDSMEVDEPSASVTPETSNTTKIYKDGVGKYRLFGFISHMGTSTSCGHYVCHIVKDGRWVIFNDRKVAISENPPKDLGYLYFYKRVAEGS